MHTYLAQGVIYLFLATLWQMAESLTARKYILVYAHDSKFFLVCEISVSYGGEYEGDKVFWDVACCSLTEVD
jgi:hypothetical protein